MVAQLDARYIRQRPGRALVRLLSYALFEGRPLTTRGRWINPLIFAHFALAKRLPPWKRVRRPVFIVGTGRSGTTVLGQVLSMHRRVGFLNEPKALWHAVHPGEDVIGSYSRGPARYRLAAADAGPGTRAAARRLFGAYLRLSGQERLVDKYPELVFRVPFVRAIFPDARFLFLVRNGWDACGSIAAWSRRRGVRAGDEVHDWWGADGRKWRLMVEQLVLPDPALAPLHDWVGGVDDHAQRAAVEWIVTMREGLRQQARFPEAVRTVRYEALAAEPRRELAGILAFCGLEADDGCLDYAAATLRPSRPHPRLALPAVLEAPFWRTLAELGYGADG